MTSPNLRRRGGPALLLALAYPFLKLADFLARAPAPRPPGDTGEGVTVFQAYLVGDCYMALPAILRLAGSLPVTVICRPDCLFLFRAAGLPAHGFANAFFARPSAVAFLATWRAARALRGRVAGAALDFDADPRTAFFLGAMGLRPRHAYRRPFGWLFERTFPLPPGALHQAGKNEAVVEGFLAARGLPAAPPAVPPAPPPPGEAGARQGAGGGLVLSCWTRKDTKNWPLERWDRVLAFLLERAEPFAVLAPPDADADFAAFRARWQGRAEFLETDLAGVEARVRASAGVVCTDNFLGHLAAHLGKPVFWINGSSDPSHVAPRGAEVVQVEPMPCRPCGHRCVNAVYKRCLLDLAPGDVIARLGRWRFGSAAA